MEQGASPSNDITRGTVDKSSFTGRVRDGKIAPPTVRHFDPALWLSAHADHRHDARDDRLRDAGLWFHEALGQRWQALDPYRLDTLPVDPVTRQLAGMANQVQLLTEAKLVEASIRLDPDSAPTGSLAHVQLSMGQGALATADMVRTSALDTLGKLAQLVRTVVARGSGRGRFDAKALLTAIPIFEDIYYLEYFWGRVLWLGWSVERSPSEVRLVGAADDVLEISFVVANWRREQLGAEFDAVYSREWAEPDSVLPPVWKVAARKRPDGYSFLAERRPPDKGRISSLYLLREMISDTELAPFLHSPLPKLDAGLTLDDLLSAWELLGLAARAIERQLFALGPDAPLGKLAPVIPLKALDALLAVLRWPLGKRAAALAFFTFEDRSQDALWTRPLLPLGHDRVAMVLTPLTSPNLYRTAELWVTEGAGEDLFRDRGTSFEAKLRADITTALADRSWRERVMVVREPWQPRIDKAPRDIDLLLRIDNVVFVGELKLKKFPVSAAEVGRHASEFAHAGRQLDIRLPWLDAHKAELAAKTGYAGPPDTLRVFGMIVTGTPFGSGTTAGGYPIIDRDALLFFFEWGQFVVAADVDRLAGYAPLPKKPSRAVDVVDADVAASFLAYVRNPWAVRYSEAGLMHEARRGRLKLSQETLSWPDHHLDGSVFGEKSVDTLIETLRSDISTWRAEARGAIVGDGEAGLAPRGTSLAGG